MLMVLVKKLWFENHYSIPISQTFNIDSGLPLLSQIESDFVEFFFYNPTLEKSEYHETFDSEDDPSKYYIKIF